MKNKLFLVITFCQVFAYGQIDSWKPIASNYSKTIFPKDDGLTYNQYVGETTAGYKLANGWRQDSINGGFNKEIYDNPYLISFGDYVGFGKNSDINFIKSFLFKKGKKFTGKIADTLLLSYSHPFRIGTYYYIETNYERKDKKMLFKAECVNGLIEGRSTLSVLNSNEVVSQCNFEKGEIIGEVIITGLLSKNTFKTKYNKGKSVAVIILETDKEGVKVEPDKPLTFKETYLALSYPYEILKQNKKAKQTYIDLRTKPGALFQNRLLLEPLNIILTYFDKIKIKSPVKKHTTNSFEVSEYKFDDYKIVFLDFKERKNNHGSYIIECYDNLDQLIMIRFYNVSSDLINNLNLTDDLKFSKKISYGYNLTTYIYDDKGKIKKASKFEGVYDNDIDIMCDYEDFTNQIVAIPNFKPISILNHKE